MFKTQLTILALGIYLCLTSPASAQRLVPTQEALLSGLGARSIAQGNALVASQNDPFAWFSNPAGLASLGGSRLDGHFGVLSRRSFIGAASLIISHDSLSERLSLPDFDGAFALSLVSAQVRDQYLQRNGSIIVTDQTQLTGQVSYASTVYRSVFAGASLKLTHLGYASDQELGVGADLGLSWKIRKDMSVGASWLDLPVRDISFETVSFRSPWRWSVGVAGDRVALSPRWQVGAAAALGKVEDDDVRLHFGGEVERSVGRDWALRARAGYDGHGATVGAGVGYRAVSLDYAYCEPNHEGSFDSWAHSVSVSLHPAELVRATRSVSTRAVDDYRADRYREYKEAAERAAKNNRYEEARDDYIKAAAFAQGAGETDAINNGLREAESGLQRQQEQLHELLGDVLADSLTAYQQRYHDSLAAMQSDFEHRLRQQQHELAASSVETNLRRAQKAFDEGDFYGALGRLALVQEVEPANEAAAQLMQQAKDSVTRQLLTQQRPSTPAALLHELDSMFLGILQTGQKVPDSVVEQWYQQGINYSRAGEYEKAIEIWQKVYEANPKHPTVLEDIRVARQRLESMKPQE